MGLPEQVDTVRDKGFIGCNNGQTFQLGLGNDHSVEGVFMVERQFPRPDRMRERYIDQV
jgi:hypothetical protein